MRKYGIAFLICLFASLLTSCSSLGGEKKSVEMLEQRQFEDAVEYSRGKNEEVQELVQNIVCVRFIRYMGDSAQHIKELVNMSEDIIWSALASYQKYSKVILDDEETDLFLDKNAQVAEILTFVQKEYPKEIFPDDFSECYDEYTDILSRMIGMANVLLDHLKNQDSVSLQYDSENLTEVADKMQNISFMLTKLELKYSEDEIPEEYRYLLDL